MPDSAIFNTLKALNRVDFMGPVYFNAGVFSPNNPGILGVYNVKDYGAVGDGATDDVIAIQAAHDAIVSSGVSGILYLPAGVYKVNSGLIFNVSFVSVFGVATLDFSSQTSGTAITITGDTNNSFSGNPFYNADKELYGLTLIGNGRSGSVKGLKFSAAAGTMAPAHIKIRNCIISQFGTGLSIEDGGYLLHFIGAEVWSCGTCISVPTASDSGEEVTFHGCAFYNSDSGLIMDNTTADYAFFGCSFDGMDLYYINVAAGMANFNNCHFEGNFGTGYFTNTRWIYVPAEGGNVHSFLSFLECYFILKQAQAGDNLTVAFCGIYGYANVHFYGGVIILGGNALITTATGVFESTTGVVDLCIYNTRYSGNATLYGTLSANCTTYLNMNNDTSIKTTSGMVAGSNNDKKKLTVIDTSSSSTTPGNNPIVWIGGGSGSNSTLSEIGFTYGFTGAYSETNAPVTIGYQLTSSSGFTKGDMVICTRNVTTDTVPTERLRVTAAGNVTIGTAALATNATDGFLYIPTCAGTPTGAPTAYTGRVPIVYDTTNNKLYIYNGAWKGGTTPGAWT